MGFSLDQFFRDLFTVLDSDLGRAKKLKLLWKIVVEAMVYAKECGQLRDD